MSYAVHRYEIPVDDEWHTLSLSGAVLHVDCRNPAVVEVWALHSGGPLVERTFRAFGTGHRLPASTLRHVGTALTPGTPLSPRGQLVWHLFEAPL